jgi:signal transduction histidine kinase
VTVLGLLTLVAGIAVGPTVFFALSAMVNACLDYGSIAYCTDTQYGSPSRPLWTVGLLLGLVLVGFLVHAVLARRALLPLRDTAAVVRRLGPQNLAHRVRPVGAVDELHELSRDVDAMLDRVAVGFAGQRRFAANASHELRTPLAAQRTLVEVAVLKNPDNDPIDRLAGELLLINTRAEALIEGLLVLAESDRGLAGRVPVRLDELVAAVLDAHTDLAARHRVSVSRELAEHTVSGDPVLLERLLRNLVHNAVSYNRPGGTIRVEVGPHPPQLVVANTGDPVPAEAVAGLFEPFRRLATDRTAGRGGSGLGLAIVNSITTAHDGTITAAPGPDGGLTVEIALGSDGWR